MSFDVTAVQSIKELVRPLIPKRWLLKNRFGSAHLNEEAELSIIPLMCERHQTCVDIGANVGLYSYVFLRSGGRVVAVEPHPDLALQLRRSFPNTVRVLNIAASDCDGVSDFHIPMVNGVEICSRSSLEEDANTGMPTRHVRVETRRLDSPALDLGAVAVLKIDVEGHELRTLAGLTGILRRSRPTLIVESEARHHPGAPYTIFDFLENFGYSGFFIHRDRLKPVSRFSVSEHQNLADAKAAFGSRSPDYINNFVFVHHDRAHLIATIAGVYPVLNETGDVEGKAIAGRIRDPRGRRLSKGRRPTISKIAEGAP